MKNHYIQHTVSVGAQLIGEEPRLAVVPSGDVYFPTFPTFLPTAKVLRPALYRRNCFVWEIQEYRWPFEVQAKDIWRATRQRLSGELPGGR